MNRPYDWTGARALIARDKATRIATEIGKPGNAAMIQRQLDARTAVPTQAAFDPALVQSFKANRAAIDAALLSKGVAHSGIAGPDGCVLCGNTIEVRGYDCWACESAFDAPVSDKTALAVKLAEALESVA